MITKVAAAGLARRLFRVGAARRSRKAGRQRARTPPIGGAPSTGAVPQQAKSGRPRYCAKPRKTESDVLVAGRKSRSHKPHSHGASRRCRTPATTPHTPSKGRVSSGAAAGGSSASGGREQQRGATPATNAPFRSALRAFVVFLRPPLRGAPGSSMAGRRGGARAGFGFCVRGSGSSVLVAQQRHRARDGDCSRPSRCAASKWMRACAGRVSVSGVLAQQLRRRRRRPTCAAVGRGLDDDRDPWPAPPTNGLGGRRLPRGGGVTRVAVAGLLSATGSLNSPGLVAPSAAGSPPVAAPAAAQREQARRAASAATSPHGPPATMPRLGAAITATCSPTPAVRSAWSPWWWC